MSVARVPAVRRIRRLLSLCWLAGAAACGTLDRPSPAPADPALEVYGRLPALEQVALSPSGARIAVVRNDPEGRFIIAASLPDGAALTKLGVGETRLRRVQWLDDDTLLLSASLPAVPAGLRSAPREWAMLQIYSLSDGRLRPLLNGGRGAPTAAGTAPRPMNIAFGPVMPRRIGGRTVVFMHGYAATDRPVPALWRVDPDSGRATIVEQGSAATRFWLVDDAGRAVVEERYDEAAQRWSLWLRHDGGWREAASSHDPYATQRLVGFGPDGTTVLVRMLEGDKTVWKPLSLADASWGAAMAEQTTWSEGLVDPASDRVLGGMPDGADAAYVFFDPDLQARWQSVRHGLRGARARLVDWSSGAGQMIVLVEERRGPTYRLIDFQRRDSRRVGVVYESLLEVAEVRRIQYRAGDGLPLDGYLTLPPRRIAEDLPLIVLVHGGPAAHETGAFDWWAQAIAAQGYAVFQPNFRGSDSDPALLAAGFGEVGRRMQTDLSDGVAHLAALGTVDPERVCIVGASYGGYAALAGVALEPGVYRCAVAVAGLSDLRAYLRFVEQRDGGGTHAAFRYWHRFLGTAGGDDAQLDAISPVVHAGAVDAPVLLIHGRDDTVVPFEQSATMAAALAAAGKPVELVTLSREDHWLSRSETRLQMLQRCVAFLREHNPPAPPLATFSGQR